MPSHLHLIASVNDDLDSVTLSDIMRDFKKFTSKEIIKTIQNIPESRREWLLDKFEFAGRHNPKIKNYQFWQEGIHPISVTSNKFIDQKLNYIHQNPVEAGFVYSAENYVLSSASAYAGELPALVDVIFLR